MFQKEKRGNKRMTPPQDKNQSPQVDFSTSEKVKNSELDRPADTEDNLKKKIEPKIDIEGINIKKLKKEDINFYFEMLPWQRDSFRKYIKEAKSETLKKVFEEIEELKERIKINGNLSYRIIETEEGEYVHKHDYILNNIVIEIIDEELTQKLKLLASPDTKPSVLHKELEMKE